jgi:integrase
MTKPLTAAAVARLKASAQRREVLDGACQGLYLVIQSSGVKSWAMRFRRPDGRQGKLTLGRVDFTSKESSTDPVIGAPMTLAVARRLAVQIQHERAQGRDVISAALRAKADRRGLAANTFPVAAKDFIEQYAKRETRGWRDTARLLGLDEELKLIPRGLAERWAERAVTDIDGDDIHAVIEETRDRGVPGAERRAEGPTNSRAIAMFAAVSKMFGWALANRKFKLKQNPCVGVGRPTSPDARDRVLSDAELAAFWRAAGDERQEFEAILKLLLLTGARLNEIADMRRAELSEDSAILTIPAERTKNHHVHVVPLPALARDILAAVLHSGSDLVFTANGRVPITVGDRVKVRLNAHMELSTPWQFRDLRRTFATGLAQLGIQPHVIEACLNHVSGHKASVAGIYNRWSYFPEKQEALERWAAHVQKIVEPRR